MYVVDLFIDYVNAFKLMECRTSMQISWTLGFKGYLVQE